jgi:Ca-activated chloride channel family protein|tara:strand:+ start:1547 stop:2635 length:1089 start_codon:yes stop_codon:yes gene_type:complete
MNEFQAALRESVEFQSPEYLAIIPVAGLVLLFGLLVFALRTGLRPVKTHGSSYPLFGHIKFWFFATIALAVLAVAAARPFWVYGGASFKRGDVDVAVAIDASASMWVRDLGPSRLDLAVREALTLYTQEILTPGDRVALFVFGTTALRQVHMSANAERFIEQVGQIGPPEQLSGDAFPWDSDVTTAFEHVFQSLDNQDRFESGDEDWQPEERSDRIVLLFTDGDFAADNEQLSRLDQALAEFRRRGLAVYPVVVGSRTGVNLNTVLLEYVRGVDYDATLEADLEGIRTRVNPDSVATFDQRAGGRSFVLDSAGLSAATFLRNVVDGHRSITFQLIPAEDKQEVWQWVVILAVAFLVIAMLFY